MPHDTGSRLRSLYAPQGGGHEVFSARVADYCASRPDYPAALFDKLAAHCALAKDALIADIGANRPE